MNVSPDTLAKYLAGIRDQNRKLRVTLVAENARCIGIPAYIGADFAIFPASDGNPTRIVPFSAILHIEDV